MTLIKSSIFNTFNFQIKVDSFVVLYSKPVFISNFFMLKSYSTYENVISYNYYLFDFNKIDRYNENIITEVIRSNIDWLGR
jgi:hypothetical protein